MSFRNLSPTYQSALDAGQLPFHIMRIAVSGNGSGANAGYGYDNLSAGLPAITFNYVEYIAGEAGNDLICPSSTATALSGINLRTNTSYQYHKRYFPNVKYWNSIENHTYDSVGAGIEVPVSANSLIGNDLCPQQPYSPDSTPLLNYFELIEGDVVYGKFNKIAVYASSNTNIAHTIKINVGEYK